MKHASDDPRLTAYLLDELDASDRAALEADLAEDPALQAELDALRATGERLSAALASEASAFAATAGPGLSETRRAALLAEAERPAPTRAPIPWRARITPFRALAAAVALLLVGAFVTQVHVGGFMSWYQSARSSSGHDSAQRDVPPDMTVAEMLLGRSSERSDLDSRSRFGPGLFAGEQAAAPAAADVTAEQPALEAELSAGDLEAGAPEAPAGELGAAVQSQALTIVTPGVPPADAGRKIIKNADMTMTVRDIPLSLGRIGTLAAQLGGYVTETRHDQSGTEYGEALVAFAVPAERFEEALDRLRGMAVSIVQEHASGEDVSQAYVDLQSEIANLEATRARIRSFLDQAQTVEESLQVNAQLAEIEGQIAERRGRLEHMAQRAAYSTITVRLFSAPPEQTPTPLPTATPVVWSAAAVAKQASSTLTILLQAAATFLIWTVIVVVPFAIPVALVVAAARRRQAR